MHPRGAFLCNRNEVSYYDSGVKTCESDFYVYILLYLCISAPLYEASCSNDSEKNISAKSRDMHNYNKIYILRL
mgnify:CR=1 FL=1